MQRTSFGQGQHLPRPSRREIYRGKAITAAHARVYEKRSFSGHRPMMVLSLSYVRSPSPYLSDIGCTHDW